MANVTYQLRYGGNLSNTPGLNTAITLNDVQNFSLMRGRDNIVDPYSPAQLTVNCRNIAAWTTPPKRGDNFFLISTDSLYAPIFFGIIRSVKINYGNVANMDTATIIADGPLARLGRKRFNAQAFAQTDTITYAYNIGVQTNVGVNINLYPTTGKSISSAQTYTGNALDLWNLNAATEIAHCYEFFYYDVIPTIAYQQLVIQPRNADQTADYVFADTTSSSTTMLITGMDFWSADEYFYNQVTVAPSGLATQTSGSGIYSLSVNSLDYTTTQALAHAQYLKAMLQNSTAVPVSFTLSYSAQGSNTTRQNKFKDFLRLGQSGQLIKITFRSTDYYCVIEGSEIGADPNDTEITVRVSDYDNNNYLTLNNTLLGRLDYNKLSF